MSNERAPSITEIGWSDGRFLLKPYMGSLSFTYSDGTTQNHQYKSAKNFKKAAVTGTINAIAYCLTPYMQGMKF